jgi:hypothetical protein
LRAAAGSRGDVEVRGVGRDARREARPEPERIGQRDGGDHLPRGVPDRHAAVVVVGAGAVAQRAGRRVVGERDLLREAADRDRADHGVGVRIHHGDRAVRRADEGQVAAHRHVDQVLRRLVREAEGLAGRERVAEPGERDLGAELLRRAGREKKE